MLTSDQMVSLYEALEIPFTATGYMIADNMGAIRSATNIMPVAIIKPYIDSFLQNLLPGSEAALVVYLTRWQALGTSTVTMTAGNIGSLTSITKDPAQERLLIQDRIRNACPFYPLWVWLQKNSGQGHGHGSLSVPITH